MAFSKVQKVVAEMKVAFYMNCVSAHQLPLAKEVAELVGPENFCYVDAGEKSESAQCAETQGLKFKVQGLKSPGCEDAREWLETADVMLTGMRDLELFERRAKKGLKTYYASERWFKPPIGAFRLLVPGYRRMVKRFVKWVNEDPNGYALTYGPWAGVDFRKMGVRPEKIVNWAYFVEKGSERRDQGSGADESNSLQSSLVWTDVGVETGGHDHSRSE